MLSKILIALVFCVGVQSFPDGAPIDACVKERANQPNHGQHRSQPLSTIPYRVVASSAYYSPKSQITDSLSSNTKNHCIAGLYCNQEDRSITIEGAEAFKGFFIQARSAQTDEWIGAWEEAPNTTIHPECASITHADPREKTRATLVWRAPKDSHGKVYFTGTVLKNYGTFWANLIAEAPQDPAQLQVIG